MREENPFRSRLLTFPWPLVKCSPHVFTIPHINADTSRIKHKYAIYTDVHSHTHTHTHLWMSRSSLTASTATSESLSNTIFNTLSCGTHTLELSTHIEMLYREMLYRDLVQRDVVLREQAWGQWCAWGYLESAGEELQPANKLTLLIQTLQRLHALQTHYGLLRRRQRGRDNL